MSDQSAVSGGQDPAVNAADETDGTAGRWTVGRAAKYIAAAVIVLVVSIFLLGLLLALLTDADATAARIQIIRDIFIIILALQGILIVIALVVLILQVARLVNLIQNEVMPILRSTQETVDTARGTVEFVGSNLTEPIIRAGGLLAGMRVLLREVGGIRRAIRKGSGNGLHTEQQ